MLELEKLKNVRMKHANDKKMEIEKLKSELEKVKQAKRERISLLKNETNLKLESLKKESVNKVYP